MRRTAAALFALVGIVHLLPGVGVVSSARLEALYGVSIAGPDLAILMRHRALLLAIVGGLLVAAALRPALRTAACAAGLVSMLSFVALALADGGANAALGRVAAIDVVASVALVAGFALGRRAEACAPGR